MNLLFMLRFYTFHTLHSLQIWSPESFVFMLGMYVEAVVSLVTCNYQFSMNILCVIRCRKFFSMAYFETILWIKTASQTMIFFTTIVYIFTFEMCTLKNLNHCQNTVSPCHWIEITLCFYIHLQIILDSIQRTMWFSLLHLIIYLKTMQSYMLGDKYMY